MPNGVVVGGKLYCRKSPSTGADYHGQFSSGALISVSAVSGNTDWWQTTWTNGLVGYVMKAYVVSPGDTIQVTATDVNVRPGIGTGSGNPLYMVSSPTTSSVLDVGSSSDGGWIKIQPSGKAAGWIRYDFLTKTASGSGSGDTGGGSTGNVTIPSGNGLIVGGGTTSPSSYLSQVREGTAYVSASHNSTNTNMVNAVRTLLRAKGYTSIASTGSWSSDMTAAVKNFQTRTPYLGSDGIVGQGTLACLEDNGNLSSWGTYGSYKLTAGKLVCAGLYGSQILRPSMVTALNATLNDTRFLFQTKVQVVHFLAQGSRETGRGKNFAQTNSTMWGGGGFMQITGKEDRYQPFSDWVTQNIGSDPQIMSVGRDRVATAYPFISAGWYWHQHRNLQSYCYTHRNDSDQLAVNAYLTQKIKGLSAPSNDRNAEYNECKVLL